MPNDSFDLSSLENFDLDGLSKKGSLPKAEAPNGKPLNAPITDLIEDPHQPRTEANPGFSKESIQEIGESIKAQGIKMPISVKSKNADGKYQINDGARRYRGAKWAGLAEVPVIIDDNFDRVAQLMVNLQREGNTPDEIAVRIAELEEMNISRVDIARGMGKSKTFVSRYAQFAKIDPMIRARYDAGDCRDVTLCTQLDDLLKEHPEPVRAFLESNTAINRNTVNDLSKRIKEPPKPAAQESAAPAAGAALPPTATSSDEQESSGKAGEASAQSNAGEAAGQQEAGCVDNGNEAGNWPFKPPVDASAGSTTKEATATGTEKTAEAAKPKAGKVSQLPVINGAFNNRIVRLVLDKKVSQEGHCWIEYDDTGKQKQIPCHEFMLVSIVH